MCLPMHPYAKETRLHPIDCSCDHCAPYDLDAHRIAIGFGGLVVVLLIIWLVWIATPA